VSSARLADAYETCERLAYSHYENFPVASWLLPKGLRPHIAAVYAFARTADDFADEGSLSPAERHRRLDDWLARLRASVSADPQRFPADGADDEADRIFEALGHTIRRHRLPLGLFEDLLSAFRQDITTTRYERWSDLLDYCCRSANPVGRIVLGIVGVDDQQVKRSSDALCTALQLTNFWQDLERDWKRGRLYVPRESLRACDAREEQLDRRTLDTAWVCALEAAAARTRELFALGRHVCDHAQGRLRLELRATWHGGMAILDRLQSSNFDVFTERPALRGRDALPLLWKAMTWAR
jgi:squalene synthase HpnC